MGDSRAKITALQEAAKDRLETVALSGGKCIASLLSAAPSGLSQKMYLGSLPTMEDETFWKSSARLLNSGMASRGLLLTVNTTEFHNSAGACLLSDILEESPDQKYLLSPKACSGILNRIKDRSVSLEVRNHLLEKSKEEAGPACHQDNQRLK